MFDRLHRVVNPSQPSADPESQSQQELTSELNEITNLSWETRIYCFAGCFILSMVCSILGSPMLFVGKLTGFAVMVSLGSVISIVGMCFSPHVFLQPSCKFSSFFLSSPMKQLKKMFEPVRIVATLLFLIMIVLTLVAGLVLINPALAVICIIGQYLAMAWYSLSYIPMPGVWFRDVFPKYAVL
uniref:Vesicle transport protein n=1 Tax=Ditylenchus dipsaci TaxID=166011 RepID=A0A915EKD2_9BILA